MRKENFAKLLETLGFYEEVAGEKWVKIVDAGPDENENDEDNVLSWYSQDDEFYIGYQEIKRGTFVSLAKQWSTTEQNIAYRAMLASIHAQEEIEQNILHRRLMPFITQAILQAVGTIPTQVNGMEDLSEEDKVLVKDMAKESVATCLHDFNIRMDDIEQYWGLDC